MEYLGKETFYGESAESDLNSFLKDNYIKRSDVVSVSCANNYYTLWYWVE